MNATTTVAATLQETLVAELASGARLSGAALASELAARAAHAMVRAQCCVKVYTVLVPTVCQRRGFHTLLRRCVATCRREPVDPDLQLLACWPSGRSI